MPDYSKARLFLVCAHPTSKLANLVRQGLDGSPPQAAPSSSSSSAAYPSPSFSSSHLSNSSSPSSSSKTFLASSMAHNSNITNPQPPTIFIDANPAAFSVIVDYIRHGKIFCPPTVSEPLVRLLMDNFGLFAGESNNEDVGTRSTTVDAPPPYAKTNDTTDLKMQTSKIQPLSYHPAPASSISTSSSSSSQSNNLLATSKRLIDSIIESQISTKISSHARSGNRKLDIIFSDPAVERGDLTGNIVRVGIMAETSRGFARSYIESVDAPVNLEESGYGFGFGFDVNVDDIKKGNQNAPVNLAFLRQPGVSELICERVVELTGVKRASMREEEVSVRMENAFGLLDTVKFQVMILSVGII
ncbi:hypothetical protein HDU76_012975 [Blyttiomyces sp. JEL0837]|nr:hypothetical protein HDU76_012975 [Blyttiomyces sp. JEL0837]